MLGHPQPVERRERLTAGEPRDRLRREGDRKQGRAGQYYPRRLPADQNGYFGEHVAKRDIVAAEDVAFADDPAAKRRQMARGDIVDMDEIEAGVDIGRQPSARGLQQDPPGRRRPPVARADRRRGMHDDRGQPLADHRLDETLGGDLAALIGADPLRLIEPDAFVGARALAQRQGRDAAGVDDALDAGARRRLHSIARSLDIGGDDLVGIARPQPIVGGDMEEIAHALHRRVHRGGIAHIADSDFDAARQVRARTGRADEHAHRSALRQQRRRHRRADKTRSAGHQHAVSRAEFDRHDALQRLRCGCGWGHRAAPCAMKYSVPESVVRRLVTKAAAVSAKGGDAEVRARRWGKLRLHDCGDRRVAGDDRPGPRQMIRKSTNGSSRSVVQQPDRCRSCRGRPKAISSGLRPIRSESSGAIERCGSGSQTATSRRSRRSSGRRDMSAG